MLCCIVCTGSVYVYGSVENIWSRQSKIFAVDGLGSDWFGISVSVYGTTAIIGATGDDDKATDAGMNTNETKTFTLLCYTILFHIILILSLYF
jgi:hypothetical protein